MVYVFNISLRTVHATQNIHLVSLSLFGGWPFWFNLSTPKFIPKLTLIYILPCPIFTGPRQQEVLTLKPSLQLFFTDRFQDLLNQY